MHNIKACVVTCFDPRFHKPITDYLDKEGYMGEADIIKIAGGAHDFVVWDNVQYFDYVMNQISKSITLHHPKKVMFIDHQDCGMYAVSGKILNGLPLNEDLEKHRQYLLKARDVVQKRFNNIEVELIFAGLDGSFTKL